MPTLTTPDEAQAAIERLQQRYAARDTIRWAIELVEHEEMIGTAGLLRFDFAERRAEVDRLPGQARSGWSTRSPHPSPGIQPH
jgi:RimJ/RimL family protein N-acetyltransferase